MKKQKYKLSEHFKETRTKQSRFIHNENAISDSIPQIFYFIDCGYEYNNQKYYHERENYMAYMITYTVSGNAKLWYKGKNYILCPGDLCIINLQNKNVIKVLENNHWEIYFIHVIGANIDDIYHKFTSICGHIKHNFNPQIMVETINKLLDGCEIYESSSLIYHLLMDILHQSSSLKNDSIGISKAITYIYENYKDDLSIDDICKEINFSKYYFIRQFKAITGVTPKQMILELRLKKACKMISSSNDDFAVIAEACGFKTSKNLYYTFEKYYGINPTSYKKTKINKDN